MQSVVMSVIRLKKPLQVLPRFISNAVKRKKTQWCIIAPLLLVSTLSSQVLANTLNNQFIDSRAISQDNKGFIWLAATNGLIRHDSEHNIVINSNNKNWPLPFNWINDIELTQNGKLLLATETHKLWLFDTSTGTAEPVVADIHHNSVYQVIEHQSMYYAYAPNKLYKINPASQKTQLLASNVSINSLEHTKNNVYVSTPSGVFKVIDKALQQIAVGPISAMAAFGTSLVIAKGNELTILSDNNDKKSITVTSPISALTHSHDEQTIFAIDKMGEVKQYQLTTLTSLTHSYPDIKPVIITKLYHDDTGVLWILSNHGVNKIMPSIAKNIAKIFDVSINAMVLTVHKNQLVLGSYGKGLGLLSENKNFLPKKINDSLPASAKVISDLYSYGDSIYLATFDGLWQFDTVNQTIERVDFPSNNLLLLTMTYKDDALYLATNTHGIIKYDLLTEKIAYHIQGSKLSSAEVIDVLPLNNNTLWAATPVGIDIIDIKKQTVEKINDFGENKVIALLEYKNKIFVSTKGDGFFIFNLQGQLLSHFAKNIIFGYMSFINGEIWISGRPGLYRLNPETYQLNMVANTEKFTFNKKPVLLNNKVYASHYGGVLEVPLIIEDTIQAKIYISKTIASGKAELLSRTISIDSSNDVVTLELASIDFRPGQEKQFKYQINGGDWHDINGGQLTLTGLSSGNYHIEIMGTNSLGQWSNFKAYTDINVSYPWYWHPNSRIIYAVLIIATILFIFWLMYLRSRSISHIHRLLNEEISTNSQSTAIIRRKLIEIQYCIEPKEIHQQEITSDNDITHAEIKPLISACLAELSTNKNHTAPSSLSGSSLTVALPYLADYFHQQYHVLITLQLDIKVSKVDYAVQSAIYRIVYEAILAAITNGNGGVFAIHINEANEKIWLKITDNEQSFAQFNSKINFDMAMYYIRQVANKFNATFHTYDNQEHGSEIILSIPLMKMS